MNIIRTIPLLTSVLILFSSSLVNAETLSKEIRKMLNEEAASTSLQSTNAVIESTPEPTIVPNKELDYKALEAKIASQIKQVLTQDVEKKKASGSTQIELENALEGVVSSALLKGNNLQEIRSAVATAMSDLQQTSSEESAIPVETIESAATALKEIVSEGTVAAEGSSQDVYIASLTAELDGKSNKAEDAAAKKSNESELAAITQDLAKIVEGEAASKKQGVSDTQKVKVALPEPSTEAQMPTQSTMSAVDSILATMSGTTAVSAKAPSEGEEQVQTESLEQTQVVSQAAPEAKPEVVSEPVSVAKAEAEDVSDVSEDDVKQEVEVAQEEVAAEPEQFDTVTVAKNETLFKIAKRVYGNGGRYLDLYEANKDVLPNPDLIKVGQVLKVPK